MNEGVVVNIRISKNESKSQLICNSNSCTDSCCKYQNIKERKQITTAAFPAFEGKSCCKYQNIKERKQITTENEELKLRLQLL